MLHSEPPLDRANHRLQRLQLSCQYDQARTGINGQTGILFVRAAEQRYELAPLPIEHGSPQARPATAVDGRAVDLPEKRYHMTPWQGTAALRDFDPPMTELGHVWTAPAVQGERIGRFREIVRVQPCIRPLNAAVLAAGPDVIR
jgi:hypothetical protein